MAGVINFYKWGKLGLLIILFSISSLLGANQVVKINQGDGFPALDSRVAILPFAAKGTTQTEADIVNELFRSSFVSRTPFTVLNRSVMDELLKEKELLATGCLDTSCIVEIGKILSMQYVIYGSLMKLGTKFYLTIEMVNIETARVAFSIKEEFRSLDRINGAIVSVLRYFPSKKKKSWVKEKGTVRFGMQYQVNPYINFSENFYFPPPAFSTYITKDLKNLFSFKIKMDLEFYRSFDFNNIGGVDTNRVSIQINQNLSINSGLGINFYIAKWLIIRPSIMFGLQLSSYSFWFQLDKKRYFTTYGKDKYFFFQVFFGQKWILF